MQQCFMNKAFYKNILQRDQMCQN